MRIHTFPLFAMSLPTTAGAVGAPGAGHLGVLDFDPLRDAQAMNLAQFTTSFIAMGLPGGSGNVPTLSPLFAGADFLTASPEGGLHLPGLPDAPAAYAAALYALPFLPPPAVEPGLGSSNPGANSGSSLDSTPDQAIPTNDNPFVDRRACTNGRKSKT
jgi:hypothetical protein